MPECLKYAQAFRVTAFVVLRTKDSIFLFVAQRCSNNGHPKMCDGHRSLQTEVLSCFPYKASQGYVS